MIYFRKVQSGSRLTGNLSILKFSFLVLIDRQKANYDKFLHKFDTALIKYLLRMPIIPKYVIVIVDVCLGMSVTFLDVHCIPGMTGIWLISSWFCAPVFSSCFVSGHTCMKVNLNFSCHIPSEFSLSLMPSDIYFIFHPKRPKFHECS